MNIDRIIARFLPVIGAVFFVIGLGYLIYTSVWLTVTQLVKVEIGLFTSLLLIGLGYSFQEKLKYYADIVIGSGILLFYGTLIYASRTTDVATAIFPEYLSLIVALVFTVSVSYFAKVRSSKAILALALLGAYLTPFVIGQEGEWQYALSYNSYLLYFFSVNLSVYALSRTLFLGDIVPLNSIGLLVGATMLKTLAYPTPVNASENFFAGDGMSGILFVLIVSVYVIALARTNRQFPEAYARFTPFGYILPFFWFIWSVSTLNISTYDFVGMYMFLSAVYLGSWHLLKSQDDQKTGRIFLYVGWISSLAIAVFKIFSDNSLYAGLALSGISLILGILSYLDFQKERVSSYLVFGVVWLTVVGFSHQVIWDQREFSLIIAAMPLLWAWILINRAESSELKESLASVWLLSSGIILLSILSLVADFGISILLLFCTIPAIIALGYTWFKPNSLLENQYVLIVISAILLVIGYFETFFTILGRLASFPQNVRFVNEVGTTAFLTAVGFFLALLSYKRITLQEKNREPSFPLVLLAYSTLLLFVSHQFLAIFAEFYTATDATRWIRAVIITLWWLAIAGVMLYSGVKWWARCKPEKILGMGLLACTLLKIIFYDLSSASTQMKVVVLMIVGGFLMFFSYYLSQKGYLQEEEEENNSDQRNTRSSDQTESVAQEESGEIAPVSKKKGGISLAKTLEGIDVMGIDRVEFSPTGGKSFHTQRESLKKIAVLVTTKFKKTSFSENELKPLYDYIVSNYVSELTKTDYEKIRSVFEQFVNAGGEVRLMRK